MFRNNLHNRRNAPDLRTPDESIDSGNNDTTVISHHKKR
jgi:hypothetical protein